MEEKVDRQIFTFTRVIHVVVSEDIDQIIGIKIRIEKAKSISNEKKLLNRKNILV